MLIFFKGAAAPLTKEYFRGVATTLARGILIAIGKAAATLAKGCANFY